MWPCVCYLSLGCYFLAKKEKGWEIWPFRSTLDWTFYEPEGLKQSVFQKLMKNNHILNLKMLIKRLTFKPTIKAIK